MPFVLLPRESKAGDMDLAIAGGWVESHNPCAFVDAPRPGNAFSRNNAV